MKLQDHVASYVLLLSLLCAGTSSYAQPTVEGTCGIYPAIEGGHIAVIVPLGSNQSLESVRWFNNDGQRPFSRVSVYQSSGEHAPLLDSPIATVEEVWGLSMGWSSLAFDLPPMSGTGFVALVFDVDAGAAKIGDGAFGGSGIGYVIGGGLRAYMSVDGLGWTSLHADYGLAVEPTYGLSGQSSMVAGAPASDGLQSEEQSAVAEGNGRIEAARTRFLEARPNPFNPRTELPYSLAREGDVSIVVYDVRGRHVRTLVDEVRPAGLASVTWHGNDDRGRSVASGAYLVRMDFEGESLLKRLTLIR